MRTVLKSSAKVYFQRDLQEEASPSENDRRGATGICREDIHLNLPWDAKSGQCFVRPLTRKGEVDVLQFSHFPWI